MEIRAIAKNIKGSPKKVRRMLDAVRGMNVGEAINALKFMPSPVGDQIAKVVKSAAANAENNYQMDPEALRVVAIKADDGMKLRRFQPMARGRAGVIHKRYSHITVIVDEGKGD